MRMVGMLLVALGIVAAMAELCGASGAALLGVPLFVVGALVSEIKR